MGTRNKLVLASLVSAMMVLACLVGLVPTQDPASIGAGSETGRLDVKEILDQLLGNKLTGEMVVNSPLMDTTTLIVDPNNPYAQVPVALGPEATAEDGDLVTFVANPTNAAAFAGDGWTGDVFTLPVPAPFSASLDLAPLLQGANNTSTSIAMYALLNATEVLKATTFQYEEASTAANSLFLNVQERALDSDGNGYVDNILDIGPGEVWQGRQGNRIVLVKNLNAPSKLDGNTEVTVGNANVVGPDTDQLVAANAVGVGESAFLLVEVGDTLEELVDAFDDSGEINTDPAAIAGWAADAVAAQPGALTTLGQYIDISIVYTVGGKGGQTQFNEVDDLSPFDLDVSLTISGLDLSSQAENPQLWSFPTFIQSDGSGNLIVTNDSNVPQEWTLIDEAPLVDRENGTLMAMSIQKLSAFAPLNSGLVLFEVSPNPIRENTETDITISALTQAMAAVSLQYASEAYALYIDNVLVDFRDRGDGIAISEFDGTSNTIYSTAPALPAGDYDVLLRSRANPNVFAELPDGLSVRAVYTLTTNLFDNTTAGGLSLSPNPTSGVGLPDGQYFSEDNVTLTIENFDASTQTAFWTVNGVDVVADGSLNINMDGDVEVEVEVIDTPPTFSLDVNLADNTTAANLDVNRTPTSGLGLDDGVYFEGDVVTVALVNFDDTAQRVTWIVNGEEIDATDTLVVTMDQDVVIDVSVFDIDDDEGQADVTGIAPASAPIFGGIVAEIQGENLSTDTAITVGGVAVQGFRPAADGSTIEVVIPPSTDTGTANAVAVDVTVDNGEAPATLAGGFTYKRVYEGGGAINTATTIDAGQANTLEIAIGDVDDDSGELIIPPLVTAKGESTSALHVIVRSAPAPMATKQNTSALGTHLLASLLGSNAGTPVQNVSDFAVFLYSDTDVSQNTPAAGSMVLANASDRLNITPGPNTTAMQLSHPTAAAGLTAADVRAGLSYWGIASSFNFANDTQTVGQDAAYQSTLGRDEVSPALTADTADDTAIDMVMKARLYSLNAFTLRSGAPMSPDVAQAILDANSEGGEGPVRGGTAISIVSPLGNLSWVDRVEFRDAAKQGALIATADVEDFTTELGTNEFELALDTPRASGPALTDVSIFLASDPDAPAVTLPGFFQFTAEDPPPLLLLLGLLVALLALFAGGDSGGGGGPCFIATAAYGTPVAAEIDTLRMVRDEYLLTNALGTAFVDTYYQVSPAIADVVAKSPALAALVRVLLVPVVFLGKVALMAPELTTFVALSLGAFYMMRRRGRQRA